MEQPNASGKTAGPLHRGHNRLLFAIAVSIIAHLGAYRLIAIPAAPPKTQAPPAKPLTIRARTAHNAAPPDDPGESLEAAFATAPPNAEPVVQARARPAPAKPRRAAHKSAPPPRKQDKPASRAKNIDAQRIISLGLAMAAAGLTDSEPEKPAIATLKANLNSPLLSAYLQAWTRKVERIGRLNYPDKVLLHRGEHSLTVDIVLASDGTITSAQVLRSSGNRALDQAALDILRVAAPFPAFPPAVSRQHRELRITRRWRFAEHTLGISR